MSNNPRKDEPAAEPPAEQNKDTVQNDQRKKKTYKKPELIKHQQINYVTAYGIK